jgi:hypothetical protein
LVAHAIGAADAGAATAPESTGGGNGIPAASAERRVGVVRVIGAHGRFVLIETSIGYGGAAVPDGQELRCRGSVTGGGAQTALLKVSRERQAPYLVADVLSGEPQAGDVAYLAVPDKKGAGHNGE